MAGNVEADKAEGGPPPVLEPTPEVVLEPTPEVDIDPFSNAAFWLLFVTFLGMAMAFFVPDIVDGLNYKTAPPPAVQVENLVVDEPELPQSQQVPRELTEQNQAVRDLEKQAKDLKRAMESPQGE